MCKFKPINFLTVLLLLIFSSNTLFSQVSQGLLDPVGHPKFVNPLPVPVEIDATSGGTFEMYMEQTQQWLGLVDENGNQLMSTVWGYGPTGATTYPGPTFYASKNTPINVNWYNNLPGHFLPVDPSMHMAHPDYIMTPAEIASWYGDGNVPTVAHLHGGHTESASDGLPEQWFTQGAVETGNYFVKTNYLFDNDQEAATLWYHDHALGITRLNVYAGLAGFYLLEDNHERQLVNNGILPKGKHDFEIVIQDKDFYDNGELFWPSSPDDPTNTIWNPWEEFIEGEGVDENPLFNEVFPDGGPTALAEFFGDFIVVNGMVWPYLDVEPRKYRFRLLNGSDSRFYVLKLFNIDADGYKTGDPITFLQIATDDGLLPEALGLTELVIAPGERAEVVIDFAAVGMGNSIKFFNFGPDSPFGGLPVPSEEQANPSTTGQIMQFNVNQELKVTKGLPLASVSAGDYLRDPITPLVADNAGQPRKLGLFEGTDEYGRLQPLLGAFDAATNAIESLTWSDLITETPALNATEEWEVYNFTGDAHPVHLHLVAFQIINREEILGFTAAPKDQLQHNGAKGGGFSISGVTLSGNPEAPADNEMGWKDTFIVPPGYVGRIVAKFDRPGRYVWHCHILSHEDHEMMRPYHVGALPKQTAENEIASISDFRLEQNFPNPFNPSTTINFSIPKENTLTSLKIYNSLGQEVGTLLNQVIPAGNHEVQFDASELSSGVYFYVLKAGNFVESRKMMLLK